MSVQAWKRRLACQWSVEKLFPAIDNATLFRVGDEPAWAYQSFGYLHTFTFADKECREDGRKAMARWQPFQEWLRRTGHRGVRVIERGHKSGHYHFHVVTDQWWSARTIWDKVREYQLGNYDVQEIPLSRIGYISKYLGKMRPRWRMPRGMRLWAAFGFRGVRTNRIRFHEKTLTVVSGAITEDELTKGKRFLLEGVTLWQRRPRFPIAGAPESYNDMNITKENAQHLTALLARGSILAVGEYRTCTAREMRFTDEDSGKEKVRKLVEHGIELGDETKSEQVTCTEWLADTADINSVKPPHAKGTPVVVEIDAMSKKYGITVRSIRGLDSFGGKLT